MDDSDSINMTNLTSQILQSPITRPSQRQSLQQIQPDNNNNNNPRLSPVKSTDPTPRKSVNVIISSEDFTNLSTPIHAIITTPTTTNSNNKFSNNSGHRNSNTKLPITNGITRTESGRLLPQIGQSKIPIFNNSNTVYNIFIYLFI